MVTTSSMATRSSLELMLDKLQQLEEQPAVPPALPVRPVSRARLPRPRRPLQLDLDHRRNPKEIGKSGGIVDHFLKRMQESEKSKERGICKIQKLYRGHQVRCCYKELREGIVALQSFIRGEIARTGYQQTSRTNFAAKHHRRSSSAGNPTSLDRRRPNQIKLQGEDAKDQTRVPYGSLVDLQKRVVKTEAKLRAKREENTELKRKLTEIEKKWQQYEERMKSMEKEWQDELTYIQGCLAAGKKNPAAETAGTLQIPMNSPDYADEGEVAEGRPQEELRKLKLRFKAWKKQYKNKLRNAQSSFRKLGITPQTANTHKNWWGRSH